MPGASYPKPDDQKVNRASPKFGWTELPAKGRKGRPPALPAWRIWNAATTAWWKALWAKPQATQWIADGSTLFALACLYDDLISNRAEASKVSAEMRQHEDRHGLNPKAMLQLRWRIAAEETTSASPPRASARAGREGTMTVLRGGAA